MHFLVPERAALAALLPGLDDALAAHSLADTERPGNPALALFRQHGGPGLLIPVEHGGLGASPVQAVRVQRAVGSRSPSLAVATVMHHFSVAAVVEMANSPASTGTEWLLLEGVARQKLYVASGFAEGRSGASILSSGFVVKRAADGLVISGSKKPCSLSASMDLLTASVPMPEEGGIAVVLVPATAPGLSRRPFWGSSVLAGAESDEVLLDNVLVPDNLVLFRGSAGRLDAVQERTLLWFTLLISASYLGIASALVERVLRAKKGTATERAVLALETEAAMASLEGIARAMAEPSADLLPRALLVRFGVQRAIERVSMLAAELLGGMAFVASDEVATLVAACRALAFHPPARLAAADGLDAWLRGEPFKLD